MKFRFPLIQLTLLALMLAFGVAAAETTVTDLSAPLIYWNDSASRTAFLEYVADVTDPASENFIPEADRLAVFDLDGTLCGEQFPIYFEWMMYCHRVLDDPDYEATEEQLAVAEDILIAARDRSIPGDLESRHFKCNGEVYAGMTTEEYRQYVADFL